MKRLRGGLREGVRGDRRHNEETEAREEDGVEKWRGSGQRRDGVKE